jgi:hypothetical protein
MREWRVANRQRMSMWRGAGWNGQGLSLVSRGFQLRIRWRPVFVYSGLVRLKAIYPLAITTNKEITSALTLDTYY